MRELTGFLAAAPCPGPKMRCSGAAPIGQLLLLPLRWASQGPRVWCGGDDSGSIELGSTQGVPNATLETVASHTTWAPYAHTSPHCW